jgi:hypothetical protein
MLPKSYSHKQSDDPKVPFEGAKLVAVKHGVNEA